MGDALLKTSGAGEIWVVPRRIGWSMKDDQVFVEQWNPGSDILTPESTRGLGM